MEAQGKLHAIPTNIITGFLGVGKTTAIKHLLQTKPAGERWAVLVNEFGEVGVDASLFDQGKTDTQNIFISEVPGGCMCCAAGLPMQVALNMLLKRAKPDRLLIEPTGLGHPKEVIAVLSAKHYQEVLAIHSTITLVDARKFADNKYTEHDTFNQQLDIADVIVANKADLCESQDFLQLIDYLDNRFKGKHKPVFPVRQGALEISWLKDKASAASNHNEPDEHHIHLKANEPREELDFPESGFISIANEGEGFFSQGWVFKPEFVFDRDKLNHLMLGVTAERAKGVFITQQGIVGFNMVDNVLTEIALDDCMDSRIEIIAENPTQFNEIEQQLLSCAQ